MGISDLKRVLLSSFHSSVIDALMKEDYEPENILSFDSHLDVMLFVVITDTIKVCTLR